MALAGRVYVALGIKVDPRDRVAGGLGDLAEKSALGTPVALAERMDGVDLGVIVRQAFQELLAAQAVETVLVGEVCEQRRQVGADVLRQREQVAALGDAYRAQLAGPGVDVAEDVAWVACKWATSNLPEMKRRSSCAMRIALSAASRSPRSAASRKSRRLRSTSVPG